MVIWVKKGGSYGSNLVGNSYTYNAFGLMTIRDANKNILQASAYGNEYTYTGRRYDSETGLYYYRNRMYSAELGRFVSEDPLGYVDGYNLYAYAQNNPLKYIDPMGTTAWNTGSIYPGGANFPAVATPTTSYTPPTPTPTYDSSYGSAYNYGGGSSSGPWGSTAASSYGSTVANDFSFLGQSIANNQSRLYETSRGWGNLFSPIISSVEGPGRLFGSTVGYLGHLAAGNLETSRAGQATSQYFSNIGAGIREAGRTIYSAATGNANDAGTVAARATYAAASIVFARQFPAPTRGPTVRYNRQQHYGGSQTNSPVPEGNVSIPNYGPLNEGPLPPKIASTFRSNTYAEVVTTEPVVLYRVYGGSADKLGGYWTRTPPSGPVQSIVDSALNPQWGNPATNVVKIKVPSGTKFYEGAAAQQGGLVGGGNQVLLPKDFKIDSSWIQK